VERRNRSPGSRDIRQSKIIKKRQRNNQVTTNRELQTPPLPLPDKWRAGEKKPPLLEKRQNAAANIPLCVCVLSPLKLVECEK
jgi:hypothetical protein